MQSANKPLAGGEVVEQKKPAKRLPKWYHGGVASAAAACCTHPLDLIKVCLFKLNEVKFLNSCNSLIRSYEYFTFLVFLCFLKVFSMQICFYPRGCMLHLGPYKGRFIVCISFNFCLNVKFWKS